MTVAAILLAAGESTRMGSLKQLLPWGGRPLIAWQVGQLQLAGAAPVVVVLGHAAEEVRTSVPPTAIVAVNETYRTGRAGSLRTGAVQLPDDVEAVVILSVDQPRPAWLAQKLIARWRDDRPAVVSPRFSRGFGHPIVIDGSLLAELRRVDDESLGLRGLIDRHLQRAVAVEVAKDEVDVDLNTPSDYHAALSAFEAGAWGLS